MLSTPAHRGRRPRRTARGARRGAGRVLPGSGEPGGPEAVHGRPAGARPTPSHCRRPGPRQASWSSWSSWLRTRRPAPGVGAAWPAHGRPRDGRRPGVPVLRHRSGARRCGGPRRSGGGVLVSSYVVGPGVPPYVVGARPGVGSRSGRLRPLCRCRGVRRAPRRSGRGRRCALVGGGGGSVLPERDDGGPAGGGADEPQPAAPGDAPRLLRSGLVPVGGVTPAVRVRQELAPLQLRTQQDRDAGRGVAFQMSAECGEQGGEPVGRLGRLRAGAASPRDLARRAGPSPPVRGGHGLVRSVPATGPSAALTG